MRTNLFQEPVISILIPVYNEETNLYNNINIIKQFSDETKRSYEIILIDDGSMDKSWDVINQLANEFDFIKGIKLSRNFGKESAILCGLKESKGNAAIIIDSDLQHPPKLIPQMVKLWEETGIDVINAKKNIRQKECFIKSFAVEVFYNIMKTFSGIALDGTTDYKLLSRKAVDAYLKLHETNRFFRAIIAWMGFNQCTIEFDVPPIKVRNSKWSTLSLINLSLNAILAFSIIPLRIITFFGLLNFVFSFILTIVVLYKKFSGQAVEGFATVIISILFTSSAIMISLGIIGEYLSKIYEEIKNRPKYLIEKKRE